jgi:negative regulator of sigma E activity
MRYLDGDTDAVETAEVEAWLASSPEARTLHGDLGQVGDAVRAVAGDQGIRADGIADRVMARLEAEPARRGRRWLALAPALGLAAAAAAAVVLYLRPPTPLEPAGAGSALAVVGPSALLPPAAVAPVVATAVAEAEPEPGASIESVDFGASQGTIFMVSSGPEASGPETPVIWLMDDPPPPGHRMKPL